MNEELDPGLVSEPDPIPVPDPVPDPTPPPVLELPPVEEPAAEPVEVISVEELLERLTQEENTELELPTEEVEAGIADVPVEPDPGMMLIEQLLSRLIDMGIDLGKIETHTKEIQKEVTVVAQAVDHPALTTSFADYTVTEALLLFLLLAAFLSACARMLRGGLLWLRS